MALWGKDFHAAVKLEYNTLTGGNAGQFESPFYNVAPNLASLYGNGLGGRLELGYIYDVNYEVLLGGGYLVFKGASERIVTTNGDFFTFEVGDYEGVPLYVGGRFLFSEDPSEGFFPYVRVDAGVILIKKVNARLTYIPSDTALAAATINTEWWEDAAVLMWDLGGGFEYRFGNFGLFGELLYQNLGKPESAIKTNLYTTVISGNGTRWQPFTARVGLSCYF